MKNNYTLYVLFEIFINKISSITSPVHFLRSPFIQVNLVKRTLIFMCLHNLCQGQLGCHVTVLSKSITLQRDCKCFGISDDNIIVNNMELYLNYYQYTKQGAGRIRQGDNELKHTSQTPLFKFTNNIFNKKYILNQTEIINSDSYKFENGHSFRQSEIKSLSFIIGADIDFRCGLRLTSYNLECSECGSGKNAYQVSMGNMNYLNKIEKLKPGETTTIPIELAYKPQGKPNFEDGKLSLLFWIQVSCVDLSQHCETAQTVKPLSGDSLLYNGNTNSTTLYNARFNYYPERGGLSSDIISNQTGREKILLYRHNRNRLTLLLKTAQNQNVFVLSDCEQPIFKYKVSPNNRTSKTLPAGNYYLVIDSEKSNEGGFSLLVKSE